jgi:hypothetical protein
MRCIPGSTDVEPIVRRDRHVWNCLTISPQASSSSSTSGGLRWRYGLQPSSGRPARPCRNTEPARLGLSLFSDLGAGTRTGPSQESSFLGRSATSGRYLLYLP